MAVAGKDAIEQVFVFMGKRGRVILVQGDAEAFTDLNPQAAIFIDQSVMITGNIKEPWL